MMRELKVFSLLKRERGRDALDLRALEDVLLDSVADDPGFS
jgi:acetate---CoA ligase (ADP-forming)